MKLKKIASLMLAGVMAVSMLAGCSGKTETKPEGGDNGAVEVTGVSADLYNELSQKAQKNVTLSNDIDLDAALKKAIADSVTDQDVINIYNNVSFENNDTNANGSAAKVQTALATALKADKNIGDTVFKDDKSSTGIVVAMAGQGVSDATLLKNVADWIDYAVEGYEFEGTNGKAGSELKNYNYSYTGSASIVEKSAVDSQGVTRTVKFVAVSITRNVVEA